MLSHAYFLAKFRFDTAENEPAKKFAKKQLQILPILLVLLTLTRVIRSAQVLAPLQQTEANESASAEQNIMDGIDLMRRTLDACRKWWEFLLQLRHGSPYDASKLYDNQGESMNDLARSARGVIDRAEGMP